MKKIGLILTTLGLFAFSVYLAFLQGSIPFVEQQEYLEGIIKPVQVSPLIYVGFKVYVAKIFAIVFNTIMQVTGHNILFAIITLALFVELVLLYPSVRIQLKQKKIHIFHKKLVDRFNRGELSVSKTEDELHKIYDVNEKIHHRGAVMVVIQIALIFFTFWGLNLMVKVPDLLYGHWSILNFSLLSKTSNFLIPIFASLVYFFHAMVKIYFKAKEDYISSAQTTIAFLFAIIGVVIVYLFASIFALALTIYFITLVTFSTIRYILVERHAKEWGAFAKRELIQMLREAKPHKNRFEYFSRIWNHAPIIRHINFNLLEEAISMSLGLLLALTFFGAFQKSDAQSYKDFIFPPAIAETINENPLN